MYLNLLHRKSGEAKQLYLGKVSLRKLKNICAAAAASPEHYFVSLIAQTGEEIEFICNNFSNIPLPPPEAPQAIWTGDLAIFIILNYPKEVNV